MPTTTLSPKPSRNSAAVIALMCTSSGKAETSVAAMSLGAGRSSRETAVSLVNASHATTRPASVSAG